MPRLFCFCPDQPLKGWLPILVLKRRLLVHGQWPSITVRLPRSRNHSSFRCSPKTRKNEIPSGTNSLVLKSFVYTKLLRSHQPPAHLAFGAFLRLSLLKTVIDVKRPSFQLTTKPTMITTMTILIIVSKRTTRSVNLTSLEVWKLRLLAILRMV